MIELTPAKGEPEITDPAFVGEWAQSLGTINGAEPWGLYVARRHEIPVGVGLFKGPPERDGWVEIGYLCFDQHRRQGVATAIADRLVGIALREAASGVRAHTLRERNGSTRVLEANGFVLRGTVVDPDDGEVWRWERELRTEPLDR